MGNSVGQMTYKWIARKWKQKTMKLEGEPIGNCIWLANQLLKYSDKQLKNMKFVRLSEIWILIDIQWLIIKKVFFN